MTKPRALFAAAALFLSLTAFTTAERMHADVTGKWNVNVQTPDQTIGSTLVVQQKGDSLTGNLQSELGSAPVAGSVKGDTVTFNFGLDMGGQAISISARALLSDKDNMSGQMDVAGMGVMPFTAKRQP